MVFFFIAFVILFCFLACFFGFKGCFEFYLLFETMDLYLFSSFFLFFFPSHLVGIC